MFILYKRPSLRQKAASVSNCFCRRLFSFFQSFPFYYRLLLISLLLISGFSYAITSSSSSENQHKFKVITTFTIIQDMAQNIARDVAVVESIIKPGAESAYATRYRESTIRRFDFVEWNASGTLVRAFF